MSIAAVATYMASILPGPTSFLKLQIHVKPWFMQLRGFDASRGRNGLIQGLASKP